MVSGDCCNTSWMPIFFSFCQKLLYLKHGIVVAPWTYTPIILPPIHFIWYSFKNILSWSSTRLVKTQPQFLKPNCDHKQSTIFFISRFISANSKERRADFFNTWRLVFSNHQFIVKTAEVGEEIVGFLSFLSKLWQHSECRVSPISPFFSHLQLKGLFNIKLPWSSKIPVNIPILSNLSWRRKQKQGVLMMEASSPSCRVMNDFIGGSRVHRHLGIQLCLSSSKWNLYSIYFYTPICCPKPDTI